LTEILVVIVLIVLIIALAVPAFNAITGTRSVDAAENLVSAMVSLGRAEAIRSKKMAGVAFFRDARTERTAMAVVVSAADRAGTGTEPPGLEQYKAWKEYGEDGTTPVRYELGDVVIALLTDANVTSPANKKTTQLFVCSEAHDASNARKPPTLPFWTQVDATSLDTLIGYDWQYLPTGVGAQTINDPDPTNVGATRDRYLRSGLILFDGDGNLIHRQYTIAWPGAADTDETHLFRVMGFENRQPPLNQTDVGTLLNYPLYSQLGVVLYDDQEYRTAGHDDADPTNNNTPMTGPEQNEEQWLDANSLSLLVNRYNGTLVRGE